MQELRPLSSVIQQFTYIHNKQFATCKIISDRLHGGYDIETLLVHSAFSFAKYYHNEEIIHHLSTFTFCLPFCQIVFFGGRCR
jgi:hypothetical protein